MIQTMIGMVMTRWVIMQRRDGAHEAQPLERHEERDEVGQRRRHAGDQDQDRELGRLRPRDAVAGRHADQQPDQHRAAGHQDRVPEIEQEVVAREHLDVVGERRRVRE